jgi:integrase
MENKPLEIVEEIRYQLPKEVDYHYAMWLKSNSYAKNTVKKYHKEVVRLIGKDDYISVEKVKAFLSKKISLPRRAAVASFRIYLEDMHNLKLPDFRIPRLRRKSKALEVISKESFDKIYNVMRDEFKLYLKVMYYGGLRVSEVAHIRVEWFDWELWDNNREEYGDLKIYKAKGNKERIVPIPPKLMQEIFDYAAKHDDGCLKKGILFDIVTPYNKKTHAQYIRKKMNKQHLSLEIAEDRYTDKIIRAFQIELAKASDIAINKKIKTHMLRASRATHLEEDGLAASSIQYLLGHENLATTSRYIINTPEKLKKQIKMVDNKDN